MLTKRLTVLMSVKNGERYIKEAVASILNQTYSDFSLLIIDNASIDNTKKIIKNFGDFRVELVELKKDIGQVAALNLGLDKIKTEYVARMDADDISLPERFQIQLNYLDNNKDIGLCGTMVKTFDKSSELYRWPLEHEDIKVRLIFENCIAHPSVMFRKAYFDKYGLKYNETIGHSEDWELWHRASYLFKIANISKTLLNYRVHEDSVSSKTSDRQTEAALFIDNKTLKHLGLSNHPLRMILRDLGYETLEIKNRGEEFIDNVIEWFAVLIDANNKKYIYSDKALSTFLKKRLYLVLNYNLKNKNKVINVFFKEKLYKYVGLLRTIKFVLKVNLK